MKKLLIISTLGLLILNCVPADDSYYTTGTLSFSIDWQSSEIPSQITLLRVMIVGEDMEMYIEDFTNLTSTIKIRDIPEGFNRTAHLEAYNNKELILYEGTKENIIIEGGKTNRENVIMEKVGRWLEIDQWEIDYDIAPLNETTSRAIILENTGNRTVTIKELLILPTINESAGIFSITESLPFILDSGDLKSIVINFTPIDTIFYAATLKILTDAVNQDHYDIILSGTGGYLEGAIIELSPSIINFGAIITGETASRNITVANTGTTPLLLSNFILSETEAFAIYPNFPTQIEPDNSEEISVTFTPSDTIFYNSLLEIQSNALNGTSHTIPIQGKGISDDTDFILIQGGIFSMGDIWGDGDNDELPYHTVSLNDFFLSKYEVTNEEFCQFLNQMGNQIEGGSYWLDIESNACLITETNGTFIPNSGYEKFPVVEVSWYGANAYCLWIGGHLPTEAQWEYAARSGGEEQKWSGTNESTELTNFAWHTENSGDSLHIVGSRQQNNIGLYDMSGNANEWCNDWYDANYYTLSPIENPIGPEEGIYRTQRGGSFNSSDQYIRTVNRNRNLPAFSNGVSGFRIVKSVED